MKFTYSQVVLSLMFSSTHFNCAMPIKESVLEIQEKIALYKDFQNLIAEVRKGDVISNVQLLSLYSIYKDGSYKITNEIIRTRLEANKLLLKDGTLAEIVKESFLEQEKNELLTK